MSHEFGGKETSDNLDTVQTQASQTSQAFIHGHRLGVIPSKRANETVQVRWDVVVLSVLGDGRGTDVLKALVGLDLV